MAYTQIHAITKTLNYAINYGVEDKTKLITDDVQDAITHIEKDMDGNSVIYKTKTSTIGCNAENADKAFTYIRNIHEGKKRNKYKEDGNENIAWHCIQTFNEKIESNTANEIGKKLAEECFYGHQCVISTHTNTDHTHNHIIFNAWAVADGKKYNDCNETKRNIRRVSDRLCEEYGLHILEETREFKTVKWIDDKGRRRFFEPTKRKDKIRRGEYSDANDYRNSEAYNISENYKRTNRETIKSDIDRLLPEAKSYEELLSLLRGFGYEIKDKKVNGDWLVYISFKAPMQEAGTRDYKLGEEYTRESLTSKIENIKNGRQKTINDDKIKDKDNNTEISIYTDDNIYQYDNIIISDIDDNYRKKRNKNNYAETEQVLRGEVEKYIISDVKKLNDDIQEIYNKANKVKTEKDEPVLKNHRSQYLLDRINANLRTLKFVEDKNIQSFAQIKSVVSSLYIKREQAQIELDNIKNSLEKASECISLIENVKRIKERIKNQQGDKEYSQYEMDADAALMKSYEDILKQINLPEGEERNIFTENYRRYYTAYERLADSLKSINGQIKEYDDCVRTINYIDRENSRKYTAEVQEYYKIKEEQKERI